MASHTVQFVFELPPSAPLRACVSQEKLASATCEKQIRALALALQLSPKAHWNSLRGMTRHEALRQYGILASPPTPDSKHEVRST